MSQVAAVLHDCIISPARWMSDEYQTAFLDLRVRLEELAEQFFAEQHSVRCLLMAFEVDSELDRVLRQDSLFPKQILGTLPGQGSENARLRRALTLIYVDEVDVASG